ncbi:unnamed protein product [Aphanomyces euteiches]
MDHSKPNEIYIETSEEPESSPRKYQSHAKQHMAPLDEDANHIFINAPVEFTANAQVSMTSQNRHIPCNMLHTPWSMVATPWSILLPDPSMAGRTKFQCSAPWEERPLIDCQLANKLANHWSRDISRYLRASATKEE